MKERLKQHIEDLKSEYEAGQKMLSDLESKQLDLRTTLLRISGAIQTLEELLGEEENDAVENGDPGRRGDRNALGN
jgi:predicted nuclease with TOPRIM domain